MASEGPNNPGTMAEDTAVGTRDWFNIDNAKTSDDNYALNYAFMEEISHYLKATNFGFSIPGGATIDGILVEVERRREALTRVMQDEFIKIVKSNGSIGTENKASATYWPYPTDAIASYGGAEDLWSESWSDTDINNANFGVVIATDSMTDGGDGWVDHIRITVYYTEAEPEGTNTQINIGDAWKEVSAMQINIGDAWKDVASAKINIGDTWKSIF